MAQKVTMDLVLILALTSVLVFCSTTSAGRQYLHQQHAAAALG